MQHLSEVAHILGAALDGNTAKVRDYADLLASKLTDDGETRQAHILRSILYDIPQPMISASSEETPYQRWKREQSTNLATRTKDSP